MARSPTEKHFCPLYDREANWTECYEVQEVRGDEMEAKLLLEQFDMAAADIKCEKCRWYKVSPYE